MIKIIVFLIIISITCNSLAIGWIKVTKQNSNEYGAKVEVVFDNHGNCNKVVATFSKQIIFKDLGPRTLERLNYSKKLIGHLDKNSGDTNAELAMTSQDKFVKLNYLCISSEELESAVITAVYLGNKKQPPVLLEFKLDELD